MLANLQKIPFFYEFSDRVSKNSVNTRVFRFVIPNEVMDKYTPYGVDKVQNGKEIPKAVACIVKET